MKMEQNMPIIAKKCWKILRVAYFMLRKGISKGKILADLNLMLKRGKIAGKLGSIHNLMFHHHSSSSADSDSDSDQTHHRHLSFPTPLNEYEFSCSNTPAHPTFHLPFHLNSKRKHSKATAPPSLDEDLVAEALEIFTSATASPALPGFGPSPMVRQLRVTDSPYPISEIEEDNHVDEAAEAFIAKFYNDLKRQNSAAYFGP